MMDIVNIQVINSGTHLYQCHVHWATQVKAEGWVSRDSIDNCLILVSEILFPIWFPNLILELKKMLGRFLQLWIQRMPAVWFVPTLLLTGANFGPAHSSSQPVRRKHVRVFLKNWGSLFRRLHPKCCEVKSVAASKMHFVVKSKLDLGEQQQCINRSIQLLRCL